MKACPIVNCLDEFETMKDKIRDMSITTSVHSEQIGELKKSDVWLKRIVWGLAISVSGIFAGEITVISAILAHKELAKALLTSLNIK